MSERRSLIEGIKSPTPKVDPSVEKSFVFGSKEPISSEPLGMTKPQPSIVARSPLSTRIRVDLAAALKRVSLERQLSNIEPHTLQDILEIALEDWLKSNGCA
jgi:hypothetical protein